MSLALCNTENTHAAAAAHAAAATKKNQPSWVDSSDEDDADNVPTLAELAEGKYTKEQRRAHNATVVCKFGMKCNNLKCGFKHEPVWYQRRDAELEKRRASYEHDHSKSTTSTKPKPKPKPSTVNPLIAVWVNTLPHEIKNSVLAILNALETDKVTDIKAHITENALFHGAFKGVIGMMKQSAMRAAFEDAVKKTCADIALKSPTPPNNTKPKPDVKSPTTTPAAQPVAVTQTRRRRDGEDD